VIWQKEYFSSAREKKKDCTESTTSSGRRGQEKREMLDPPSEKRFCGRTRRLRHRGRKIDREGGRGKAHRRRTWCGGSVTTVRNREKKKDNACQGDLEAQHFQSKENPLKGVLLRKKGENFAHGKRIKK